MLVRVTVICVSFLLTTNLLFAQKWATVPWVEQMKGDGREELFDVAIDPDQNVFTCGLFEGTISLNGISIIGRTDGNRGNGLVYKTNPQGDVLWTKRIGGSIADLQIETDSDGNVYVYVGTYEALFVDDVLLIPPINKTPTPGNLFLLKLDNDGNILWAKALMTYIQDSSLSWMGGFKIMNDQIYTVGNFVGTISLDGFTFSTDLFHTIPFFARYDLNGNIQVAKQLPTVNIEQIEVDKNGFFYLTGAFATVEFDSNNVFTSTIPDRGDFYVAKFDDLGNFVWARVGLKTEPVPYNEIGKTVAADDHGNVYVMGWIKGSVNFNSVILTGNLRENYSDTDMFLAKYNEFGDLQYVKLMMLKNYGTVFRMHTNGDTLLVAGALRDAVFTPFYGKYDLNGDSIKMEYLHSGGFSFDVAQDKNGNIYLAGSFGADFNYSDCKAFPIQGGWDGFLAKIGSCNDNLPPLPNVNVICASLNVSNADNYCVEWIKDGQTITDQKLNSLSLTESGNYQAVYKNACGNTPGDIISIDYNALENVPIEPTLDLACNEIDIENANNTFTIDWLKDYIQVAGAHNPSLSVNAPGSYQAVFRNNCGETSSDLLNISEFEIGLPVKPNVEKKCSQLKVLNSNEHYVVKWFKDGVLLVSNVTSVQIDQTGNYQVVFSNLCGDTFSEVTSVSLPDTDDGKPYIYNVITPNGDDNNEIYKLNDYLQGSSLMIINRWGESVYISENYQNDWRADNLASGIYYYIIRNTCFGEFKGPISIVK